MAKTAVYFELAPAPGSAPGTAYTVPAGKHLIVTNHRVSTHNNGTVWQSIVVNGGESGLYTATGGRITGAVLPSGTTLQAIGISPDLKQSISGYLVDN